MRRMGITICLILAWLSAPVVAWPQAETGGIRLENLTPADGTEGVAPLPSISATFAGGRAGVNAGSVRVILDETDVTGQSVITLQSFSYRPSRPLAAGVHRVRVALTDQAGAGAGHTWTFVVGSRPARIDRVVHNAVDRPLVAGDVLQVTISGTPGAQVEVWVLTAGQTSATLAARESSAGVYVASLPVKPGDRGGERAVLVRLTQAGARAYQAAAQPVVFAVTQHPLQPRVLNLTDGQRVGTAVPLQGQTQPNATVRVRAFADTSLFGALAVRQDLTDERVQADGNGQFTVQIATGSILSGSRVRVEVTATSEDGKETSPATILSLTRE